MMQRQFLNIVVREDVTKRYAVHRIRLAKNLFYEATENATAQEVAKAHQAAKAKKKNRGWPSTLLNLKRLPRPEIYFSVQPALICPSNLQFFSLLPGQGEGSVMFINHSANVSVYDVDMQSVVAMPPANFCKPAGSITLSIRNQRSGNSNHLSTRGEYDLYVMGTHDGSFEHFNYCRTSLSACPNDWYWMRLRHVPPCVAGRYYYTGGTASPPFAAAVVDSSTICASSKEGTYAFDRLTGSWRQSGRWMLPFHGAADHVPEFRLWFGLEDPNSSQHRLCAFDLASSAMAEEAPAPLHAWDYLDGLPDGWCLSKRHLVNLGLGKFCIATHCFHRPSPEEEADTKKAKLVRDEVTVLTGVEVVRAGDGLQMIKHKSRHYSHENMGIHCVL
ncbi:unnamed protein product [Alopecurus aequalis]